MTTPKVHLLRVNPTATLGHVPNKLGDKVPHKYISGTYTKRERDVNEADPVNRAAITRPGPYQTGDGDFPIALRPGAHDHKKYKSLVTGGTIIYPRGHI
jgi:hypothetical protein